MAQFGRPDSDVTVNSWTPTPLWQQIDETPSSDLDLISGDNNTNDLCEVGLSDVNDPQSSSGHIVRYRYRKNLTGGNSRNITVGLVQGTTVIASQTHNNIGGIFVTGSFTLSGAQADSITNYADLRLRFTASGDTGGNPTGRRSVQVSWAEFEVPDAVSTTPITLSATATGVATIDPLATFFLTLAITSIALVSMSRLATRFLILSATSVANSSIVKEVGKILSSVATGVASLAQSPVIGVGMLATAVSSATISTVTVFSQVLSAVASSAASFTKLVGISLSSSSVGVSSFTKKVGLSISATAGSASSFVKGVFKTISATSLANASISAAATLFKTLQVSSVGVATMTRNVITGAVGIAVKRIGKWWFRSHSE